MNLCVTGENQGLRPGQLSDVRATFLFLVDVSILSVMPSNLS